MKRNEFKELLNSNKQVNEIKSICEKYGYEAKYCYIEFNSPRVGVRALDWKCKFCPDVMLKHSICPKSINPEDWTWEINSGAFGSMEAREFKVMMYYFNQALKMAEELNQVDLSKLPVIPEKFDEDDED